MWCGTALARRACRDGLSASGPVELCRVNDFAIRGALRPYIEFIPDALHREDESRRLRVRLYLAPQAGDEHIDAAVIGFRATTRNGVTELVTRQYPARTVYEGGQQRGLGAGQPHFPAAAIDKSMAGKVELAVLDFYRRWDSFIALAPWRRRWLAEPIEQLLFVQSVFGECICRPKQTARSDDVVGLVPSKIVVGILLRNFCPRSARSDARRLPLGCLYAQQCA